MPQECFFLFRIWSSHGAAMLVRLPPIKSRKKLAHDVIYTYITHSPCSWRRDTDSQPENGIDHSRVSNFECQTSIFKQLDYTRLKNCCGSILYSIPLDKDCDSPLRRTLDLKRQVLSTCPHPTSFTPSQWQALSVWDPGVIFICHCLFSSSDPLFCVQRPTNIFSVSRAIKHYPPAIADCFVVLTVQEVISLIWRRPRTSPVTSILGTTIAAAHNLITPFWLRVHVQRCPAFTCIMWLVALASCGARVELRT